MMLPNFLIIGQIKAGTTSLYNYLNQHPNIYMSPLKEARFFAFDNTNPQHLMRVPKIFPITTMEDYMKLFAGARREEAIGEASPNYFNSPIAAKRIKESLPNAKLIASLRNPADRMYSLYLMHVRGGRREKRSFIEAFREDPQKWWIKSSFAYENLKRYFDLFDSGQLKVILFDELIGNPAPTVRQIFHFLEVDPDFTPDASTIYNPGGIPKNKVLHVVYRLIRSNRKIRNIINIWVPESLVGSAKTVVRQNLRKAPNLEPHIRKEIIDYYRDDTLRLQDLIKRDLSLWLR